MREDLARIGAVLKQRIEASGLANAEIAARTGVPSAGITAARAGCVATLTLGEFDALISTFAVEPVELY